MEVAVRVQPRARSEGIGGLYEGALQLRVQAPPAEGRANEAACRMLAAALGVPRRSISLVSGVRARRKRLRVAGDPDALARSLRGLAAPQTSV